MDDLKNIPKKNARRRGVMKGAAVTAGLAGAYTAPVIQKIAVSVAQAAGSVVTGQCVKYSLGGQSTVTSTLGGTNGPTFIVTATLSSTIDATLSGIVHCCSAGCAAPSGNNLQVSWTDNGNNTAHFHDAGLVSCSSADVQPGGRNPVQFPNQITLTWDGDYNLGGSGGTGTCRLQGTFTDLFESGIVVDQTNMTLTSTGGAKPSGTVLITTGGTETSGNYQALQVTSC